MQLDLYGVAEQNNYEHKLMTLSDMVFELLAPYGEVRLGSAAPSDEQAFYLRHGETPDSLKVRGGAGGEGRGWTEMGWDEMGGLGGCRSASSVREVLQRQWRKAWGASVSLVRGCRFVQGSVQAASDGGWHAYKPWGAAWL